MSADLLAEFDAYYTAPKQESLNIASDGPSELTSGLDDLSIFNQSSTSPVQRETTSRYNLQKYDVTNSNTLDDFYVSKANIQETQKDFDAWGEFESSIVPTTTIQTSATQGSNKKFEDGLRNTSLEHKQVADGPKHGMTTATTNFHGDLLGASDAFQSSCTGFQTKYPPSGPSIKSKSADSVPVISIANDSNILFDVDNVSDDDEFGDFETVPAPPQEQHHSRNPSDSYSRAGINNAKDIPYLGIRTHQSDSSLPAIDPKSALSQEGNPSAESKLREGGTGILKQSDPTSSVTTWPCHPGLNSTPESSHKLSRKLYMHGGHQTEISNKAFPVKTTVPLNSVNDDSWDWDSIETMSTNISGPSASNDLCARDVVDTPSSEAQISSSISPPPTNIPPPSVLLTLFPHLLDISQSSLFQPVARQPFSLKNRILSDPSTIDFMRAYILLATVAGRIIAGRKFRWKRDIHLSQSMKIGPAVARGKSGMKLVGVDKAEIGREDREANEFIRTWKDQVGRLRSAVAIANSSIPDSSGHLIVPEISDSMSVHTVSPAEGAFTAPKPCFICGLKRDERISKVDSQVEDSFGEWWVEHWGHTACRNFWIEQNNKLKHS